MFCNAGRNSNLETDKMRCAITGSTGYLGKCLKNYFEKHGWSFVPLTSETPGTGGDCVPFRLNGRVDIEQLKIIDVLIHCAYDFSVIRWGEIFKINVEGTRHLLLAARSAGVRKIILISTMSAFPGCRSFYGRAKLLIEEEAKKVGAFIVRPGLVYDSQSGSMVGSLLDAVRRLPCIPVIGNGKQVLYLLHAEDLCRFIFQLVTERISGSLGPITLAHEQGFAFQDILKIIAKAQGKTLASISIPAGCFYVILRIAEILGFRGRLRCDSLRSLIHYDPSPSFAEMRRLGFSPRLFSEKALREDTG